MQLNTTLSPHLKKKTTVSSAMGDVFIALMPVTLVSIYFFRLHALFIISVCLITAAVTEVIFRKAKGKKPTLYDGSAVLTGLFVALLLSPTTGWFTAAMATFIGVGVAKELMGGLGWNRFNPALFGRVAMIILAPWLAFSLPSINLGTLDAVSQATPLAMLKSGMAMPGYLRMFLAYPGGALSETSVLALLLGGAYLIYRGHISWRIPATMIGTVALLTLLAGHNPLYHVLSGGLMIGAFFMATDWVTSPITDKGKLIFGVCIGLLIVIFRLFLPPTEGVAFSILIMNPFVRIIDNATRRRTFGKSMEVVKQKQQPVNPSVSVE